MFDVLYIPVCIYRLCKVPNELPQNPTIKEPPKVPSKPTINEQPKVQVKVQPQGVALKSLPKPTIKEQQIIPQMESSNDNKSEIQSINLPVYEPSDDITIPAYND